MVVLLFFLLFSMSSWALYLSNGGFWITKTLRVLFVFKIIIIVVLSFIFIPYYQKCRYFDSSSTKLTYVGGRLVLYSYKTPRNFWLHCFKISYSSFIVCGHRQISRLVFCGRAAVIGVSFSCFQYEYHIFISYLCLPLCGYYNIVAFIHSFIYFDYFFTFCSRISIIYFYF